MSKNKNIKISISGMEKINWAEVSKRMARAVSVAGVSVTAAGKALAGSFNASDLDDIPESSRLLKDAVEGAEFLKCPQCGNHILRELSLEVTSRDEVSIRPDGDRILHEDEDPLITGWFKKILGYGCDDCDKYYRLVDGQLAETDIDYFMKGGD